jgi:hypothetical protein
MVEGFSGKLAMAGSLAIQHHRIARAPWRWHLRNRLRWGYWHGWLSYHLALWLAKWSHNHTFLGTLEVMVTRANGERVHYGIVGYKAVTTAFVNFVVDQLQTESSLFGDFKYHDSGVGTTAENITDTAMETTDGESRVTGTQTESAANAYRSVGVITYTTTKAITEHGLFNDPTGATLMDRTVFSAVNVVNTETITFTYTLTLTAGS